MTVNSSAELLRHIAKAMPEQKDSFALATVQQLSPLYVAFEGQFDDNGNPLVTQVALVPLDSYNPFVGDRVVLARVGKTWVIVNSISENVPWTPLPFNARWTNYSAGVWDACQYRKFNGIVYLRGLFKPVSASSGAQSGDDIATMPVGCRGFGDSGTNGDVVGTIACNANGVESSARIQIFANGTLHFSFPVAQAWITTSNFTLGGSYIAGN
jgi:hypothetical protein